nr:TPA_inf: conotoxin precursor O2 [Conus judaeus]
MDKQAILLLLVAVLMLTQALNQDGEVLKRMKNNFVSKRKSTAESWWEGECLGWSNGCESDSDCCSGSCDYYCEIW